MHYTARLLSTLVNRLNAVAYSLTRGNKADKSTYVEIASEIHHASERLFALTDIVVERPPFYNQYLEEPDGH